MVDLRQPRALPRNRALVGRSGEGTLGRTPPGVRTPSRRPGRPAGAKSRSAEPAEALNSARAAVSTSSTVYYFSTYVSSAHYGRDSPAWASSPTRRTHEVPVPPEPIDITR